MPGTAPGPTNVFVPTFSPGATGALQTEFSRNPASFALNKYVQVVPVEKRVGKYLRIDPDDAGRIVTEDDYTWPDTTDRPRGEEVDFSFPPYETTRHSYGFRIGFITEEQADWDIIASHARAKAQKAMTFRTLATQTLLATAANWPADNFGDGDDFSTGFISGGADGALWTEALGVLQGLFQSVRQQIVDSTVGAVDIQNEFVAVMGPEVAVAMSRSPEVKTYVKNYPRAEDFLRGSAIFQQWGLPPDLWGVKVEVDHTVRISTHRGAATKTSAPIWDTATGSIAFLSRPGALVGTEGVPSFSTVSLYVHSPGRGVNADDRGGDMAVETIVDPWNRVTNGSVVDDFAPLITAPIAGAYVNGLISGVI